MTQERAVLARIDDEAITRLFSLEVCDVGSQRAQPGPAFFVLDLQYGERPSLRGVARLLQHWKQRPLFLGVMAVVGEPPKEIDERSERRRIDQAAAFELPHYLVENLDSFQDQRVLISQNVG